LICANSKRSIDYATKYASEHGLEMNYVLEDYLSWETTHQADPVTLIFCDLWPVIPTSPIRPSWLWWHG
jgi:hypothetical protein